MQFLATPLPKKCMQMLTNAIIKVDLLESRISFREQADLRQDIITRSATITTLFFREW